MAIIRTYNQSKPNKPLPRVRSQTTITEYFKVATQTGRSDTSMFIVKGYTFLFFSGLRRLAMH